MKTLYASSYSLMHLCSEIVKQNEKLYIWVSLQVCLSSNVKLEWNSEQYTWTGDTASARTENESANSPRLLDCRVSVMLWSVPTHLLPFSYSWHGTTCFSCSLNVLCMHIFFCISHGVLYPALYFSYFHVLGLNMGSVKGFMGAEVRHSLCD